MHIATEHKAELFDATVAADLVVVQIDRKDVTVMLSETTDPRLAAKILRDIADSIDDDARRFVRCQSRSTVCKSKE